MDNKPLSREKLSGILIKYFEICMSLYLETDDKQYLKEAEFTQSRLNGLVWEDFRHYGLIDETIEYTVSGSSIEDYMD
jgi:hypothetical protein